MNTKRKEDEDIVAAEGLWPSDLALQFLPGAGPDYVFGSLILICLLW